VAEASAPASSANLGPGFDCLALAIEMRCRVAAEPADRWSVRHAGLESLEPVADDGVLAAARAAVGDDRPLALVVDNDIPIGRGLGSSAAAFAAGALAAWRAVGEEPRLQRLFRLVAALEGHPDNAAAAVYGGFVLAAVGGEAIRLPWNPYLRIVLAVPHSALPTQAARRVLPAGYPAEVVVRSLSRLAALMAGLLTGDAAALAAAAGDELHEAPRNDVRPEVDELIRVARAAGAFHAAWSGAGPSTLAIVPAGRTAAVREALAHRLGNQGTVVVPSIAVEGAR
jgi:homoserine kinase